MRGGLSAKMAHSDNTLPEQQPIPSIKDTVRPSHDALRDVPRWPVLLGLLALGVLYAALPERFTLGPSWLPLVIECILILPFILERFTERTLSYRMRRSLALTLLAIVTLGLVSAVTFLILTLANNTPTQAVQLLRTAALIWVSNVLVFALWYWEIDGGGPERRHKAGHKAADFLFPQQTDGNTSGWAPHFLDYVFLAFTAATALSPTDTFPLTRAAKGLMMVEAIVSLIVIVLLAARAVNIL
jgi:uncharacterized membrane protein